MTSITEQQEKILTALEEYRFLTNSQLVTLGAGHIQRVRQTTSKLSSYPSENKPLVYRYKPGVSATLGRLENVFWLSQYGAEILADIQNRDFEEVGFLLKVRNSPAQYWHRKYCVDFHIALNQALKKEYPDKIALTLLNNYFDKTGANHTKQTKAGRLRSATRADYSLKIPDSKNYIIPDINFIFQVIGSPDKKALFCVEMSNGRDTKRILNQIREHKEALKQGVLTEKYGLNTFYKALFIFSEEGLLNAVLKRFFEIEGVEAFQSNFYFAHLADLHRDFFKCWQRPGETGAFNFLSGKRV